MTKDEKRWECVNCGTKRRKKASRGYCQLCYRYYLKLSKVDEWSLDNLGSTPKGFPKWVWDVHFSDLEKLDIELFDTIKRKYQEHYNGVLNQIRIRERKVDQKDEIDGMQIEMALRNIFKQLKIKHDPLSGVCNWYNHEFNDKQRRIILSHLYIIISEFRFPTLSASNIIQDYYDKKKSNT